MLRRLRSQRGQALPLVIACMAVFSISVGAVMVYSSGSQRQADSQKKATKAEAAAEAALATADSVLYNTAWANPLNPAALPSCTVSPGPTFLATPPPGTTASYCGQLNGMIWTITATGTVNTTAAAGDTNMVKTRVITQTAEVKPASYGGLGPLWDRIYHYDTSKCAVFNKQTIRVPVVVRGCAQLNGDDAHPTTLIGNSVWPGGTSVAIGGNVTIKDQDSIGTSSTPLNKVEIAGTCTLEHGSGAHTPCGPADHVYSAIPVTTAPDFSRPAVDFVGMYTNANLGPMDDCTPPTDLPTSPVTKFDKNTTYNRDNPAVQLTPSGVSYDCQHWTGGAVNSGTMDGRIKWDAVEQILTVKGTIFFDGDVKITAPGHSKACNKADHGPFCDKSFSYNGNGTIYTSGKVDLEAGLCSGGDGSNDCENDPSNWDPTQNLLMFYTGGLKNLGDETFTMKIDEAVFQGAVYTVGKCKVSLKASFSAPMICGQDGIKEDTSADDPTINPWPASLINPHTGQLWPQPPGDWNIFFSTETETSQ